MTLVTIPASFSLNRYRLELQAQDPIQLSRIKSSALRGGFGHVFKQKSCLNYTECENKTFCPMDNNCPYGYIFETSAPIGAEALRNIDNVPRPFVIETTIDNKLYYRPGEIIGFDLILIGQANQHRQDFFDAFEALGADRQWGLGKTKGRYKLLSMKLLESFDEAKISTRAASLSANQIALDFLTPTRLKHKGRWVDQGPSFQALIKVLLSRTSSLSYFHCGERLDVDFRGLIDQAAAIKTAGSQTHRENWSRFSGRQKQRVDMGGLVGRVTYAGDLQPYLPLLALGELIHVGKGNVFGNGQYKIIRNHRRTK